MSPGLGCALAGKGGNVDTNAMLRDAKNLRTIGWIMCCLSYGEQPHRALLDKPAVAPTSGTLFLDEIYATPFRLW